MTKDTHIFDQVIDQKEAITQLRKSAQKPVHAYLFVGPKGSCRWEAAKAFSALILGDQDLSENSDRSQKLALQGDHPDLIKIDPSGNQYRDEDVQRLINEASRSPIEGSKKIIVANRFHTANPTAVGRLLKTLEEPPESIIIILISENIPDSQITIASRCQNVHFHPISPEAMKKWLSNKGLSPDKIELISIAAGGDLERANDLISDTQVASRYELWKEIPNSIGSEGYKIAVVVDEIQKVIDQAQEGITLRHQEESEALGELEKQMGIRGSGRKELEAKHKREIRRFRTDELQFGLSIIANLYKEELVEAPNSSNIRAIEKIRSTMVTLGRNPNEKLLLQSLFISLSEFK
ncbi:MAG: hypothetical protein CL421_02775 [Acidimicrobiaceae bacterium]|nr:hypothetical protein [Acidimicrobiaceae bacterium]|tara:strand:+ start:1886 stop:2938 length:1053 start_codon:yes stop_codon:yes gene_type:complete